MGKKTCVIINDFTTCEEIALGIQMPILREKGVEVFPVPTKLLSYPLCRQDAVALSTVDFAKEMLNNWISSGEVFDMVLTGFIPDTELSEEVRKFCLFQKNKGAVIIVDPVFGDYGHAYKSVRPENIEAIKRLLGVADYCLPNYTEACLLTGIEYTEDGIEKDEAAGLLNALMDFGVKNPVVTGVHVKGISGVIMLSAGEATVIPYTEVSGGFPGTGDRFAAHFAVGLIKGESIENAINRAETIITELLKARVQE